MVIGGLYGVWETAVQHHEDGFLADMSLDSLGRKGAYGQGTVFGGGVAVAYFDEHNEASAMKWMETAKL